MKRLFDIQGGLLGMTYINWDDYYIHTVSPVPGGYVCQVNGSYSMQRRSHLELIDRFGIKGDNKTIEYQYRPA